VIWVQCNALRRPAALRQSRVQVLRLPRVPYSEAGVFRLSRDGGLAAPSIIYKCEMVRLRDSKWEYGITFRRRIFPTAAERVTRESAAALALCATPPRLEGCELFRYSTVRSAQVLGPYCRPANFP
jgi:hypothetical protein